MLQFRALIVGLLASLVGCASPGGGSNIPSASPTIDAARRELAPTGTLRVSVLLSPSAGTILSTRKPDGTIEGVTATLGTSLARELGVPVALLPVPSIVGLVDSMAARQADVTFTIADPARRQDLDYGPRYAKVEFTFLVSGKSGIDVFDDINRPSVRVLVSSNSPFNESLLARFPHAKFVTYGQLAEGAKLFAEDKGDALFFGRNAIDTLAARIPGSKVLGPAFAEQDNVIAVQKGRPLARAYAAGFMERAKASGLIRKALDDAGLPNVPVAP